jgi:3-hydroxyacyl-[acyl-carrier-protein] dehydratase
VRFYLVDGITRVAKGEEIAAFKFASPLDPVLDPGPALPPTLAIEALAQSGAWLVMATTDFAQRGVLGTFRQVEVGKPAPLGSRVETDVRVRDWTKEAVVFDFLAHLAGEPVVRVEHALCFLIDAETLEDTAQTRAQYRALDRTEEPAEEAAPALPMSAALPASAWYAYDAIAQITPGEQAVAHKSLVMTDPVFATHFPRFPVVPGVLLMQSVLELGRALLAESAPAGERWRECSMSGVRFPRYVRPGDRVAFTARLLTLSAGEAELTGAARVGGRDVFSLRRLRFQREAG